MPKSATLFINGIKINTGNVKIYDEYAELPLIEVFNGFGNKIEWLDSKRANMIYKDVKYDLNLEDALLVKEGTNFNLLLPPPGNRTYHLKTIDGDLILDHYTIKTIMYEMGEKIDVKIDRDKMIVYITRRKE
jgi:hypothetical protein